MCDHQESQPKGQQSDQRVARQEGGERKWPPQRYPGRHIRQPRGSIPGSGGPARKGFRKKPVCPRREHGERAGWQRQDLNQKPREEQHRSNHRKPGSVRSRVGGAGTRNADASQNVAESDNEDQSFQDRLRPAMHGAEGERGEDQRTRQPGARDKIEGAIHLDPRGSKKKEAE